MSTCLIASCLLKHVATITASQKILNVNGTFFHRKSSTEEQLNNVPPESLNFLVIYSGWGIIKPPSLDQTHMIVL